jgi:glycine betaine/proline transport system ATP-binding protein
LLDLQQSLNKTILFVSHDLDEALKLGNHIAIMEGGYIVQYGRPEDIVLNPANAYVADFVAHMNPLNVLRGGSLMTPAEKLKREGEEIVLDQDGHMRLTLDAKGAPKDVTLDQRPGRIVPYEDGLDVAGLDHDVIVTADPDMKMRTAIELRHATGRPVILVSDGRMVGVCGDDEIYQGILRQTGSMT